MSVSGRYSALSHSQGWPCGLRFDSDRGDVDHRLMDRRLSMLSSHQHGIVTRSQLAAAGVSRSLIRAQLQAHRWTSISPVVLATTTGELTRDQRAWAAVLHAGGGAILGGLSAAAHCGLKGWEREEVCVLVPYAEDVPTPLLGARFVRTRRDLTRLRARRQGIPRCRIEPAILMFAAEVRSTRAAEGVLAAAVQQQVADAAQLAEWVDRLAPLKRAPMLRQALAEIAGGAQSTAEIDVRRMCKNHGLAAPRRQTRRRDATGRIRYTDCEWTRADGRVLVLEVDGSFHMAAEHWEDDLARQRALAAGDRVIVRCTAREVRDDAGRLADDLRRLGVPTVV